MKPRTIKIQDITRTTDTQIRATIDVDTVDQYAIEMAAGVKFPPVVVFGDGLILADGFHRIMAAERNGETHIIAEIQKGTKSDALKYALGANIAHGLRRTNADKRRSVELALAEWPNLSDREIARICAVGAPLAGDVRNCNNVTVPQPPTRTGADGKKRKLPKRKKPKKLPEPDPPPSAESESESHVESSTYVALMIELNRILASESWATFKARYKTANEDDRKSCAEILMANLI